MDNILRPILIRRGADLPLLLILAGVIGGLVAWAKLRGPRWLVALANGYSTICRAVPEVLMILILYYAGQQALNGLMASIGLGAVGIDGFYAARLLKDQ